MQTNLGKLDQFDANIYAISHDSPEQLKQLSDAMEEQYPREDGKKITFLSDPNLEFIEYMDMRNGETAYRGFGLMDTEGNKVFSHINDHWGEEFDKSLELIEKEYKKMKE